MRVTGSCNPLVVSTALAFLLMGIGLTAAPALYADIMGLDDPGGFSFATNGVSDPTIVGSTATITTEGETDAAKAVWYNTKQNIKAFYTTWDYTNVSGPDGDPGEGMAFVVQNVGPGAVGDPGRARGYGGTALWSSVSLLYNINPNNTDQGGATGSDIQTAAYGDLGGNGFNSTSPVDLRSGHPIRGVLWYIPEGPGPDGDTFFIHFELWDLVTGESASYVQDIDQSMPFWMLNSDEAYIGFTGGTSDLTAEQTIDNFIFETWHLDGDLNVLAMTWNEGDNGDWGTGSWDGGPGTPFPSGGTAAVVDTAYTVTVEQGEDRRAYSLDVSGDGDVVIAGDANPANAATLTATMGLNVAAGSTLAMGDNTTLAARGGVVDTLTTAGDATIDVLFEELAVTNLADSAAGTLLKRGPGTLALDTLTGSVSAGNTTFRVETGTLSVTGPEPFGGTPVQLAGGTLEMINAAGPISFTTPITASGTSGLGAVTDTTASFGSVTLSDAVLTVSGAPGGVTFTGTTLSADSTAVGVNTETPTDLGAIDVLNTTTPLTFSKGGSADMELTLASQGTNGFPANMTFDVQGGRLIGVHDSDPFDQASLQLSGGELVLASLDPSPPSLAVDHALTVTANSRLTAGTGGVGGAASDVDVILGSAGKGVALTAGTLTVQTTDGYTLDVSGPVSGDGGLELTGGTVTISGGGTAGSLEVGGGATLNLGADIEVQKLQVSDGALIMGGNSVTVGNRMILADTPTKVREFEISDGDTFVASGADLGDPGAERTVLLTGGNLKVRSSPMPLDGLVGYWGLDDGPGSATATDSAGGHDGTLINMVPASAWVAGHTGQPGDWALDFPGGDFSGAPETASYVSVGQVPELKLTGEPNGMTISAWVKATTFDPNWAGVAGWNYDSGGDESGYVLCADNGASGIEFGLETAGGGDMTGGAAVASGLSTATWYHIVGVYDRSFEHPVNGTVSMKLIYSNQAGLATPLLGPGDYKDGNVAEGAIDWTFDDGDGFEIGRYHDDNEAFVFTGAIDDVVVYDRPLSEAEMEILYHLQPGGGELDLPKTHLMVSESTTIVPFVVGEALFGDVTIAAGKTLAIDDTDSDVESLNINDLDAGDGSTLDASAIAGVFIRGVVSPGSSVGSATVVGNLEMDEGGVEPTQAGYHVELAGADNDVFTVHNGDAAIAGTLTAEALGKLDTSGVHTRTILQLTYDPGWEVSLEGTFGDQPGTSVPQVGTAPPAWTPGTYLGSGVWFGDDRTGVGLVYGFEQVDMTVFQAKEGDTNGNRDVAFADFNDLANNYTGSLAPGVGGKDWTQGDFDLDQDVDFPDFNYLANNYTGTGIYYAKKGQDVAGSDAVLEGADPELIVNLGDGSVVMTGGPVELNGYSVTSASGSLLTDDFPMPLPLQFYMSNSTDEITAGVLGTQIVLDGSLEMPWGIDVGGLKGEPDLVFNYGTPAGTFQGNVVYVVPEPATLVLLVGGLLGLLLLWRRPRAA